MTISEHKDKQKLKALIVDDESDICDLLTYTLKRMDIDAKAVNCVSDAKQALHQEHFSFCITDMKMPGEDGMSLVKYVNEVHPNLPIAMLTAHGNMDMAVSALKSGAFDFIPKPVELERLRSLVKHAGELATHQVSPLSAEYIDDNLIGESESIRKLKTQIAKLANSPAPIFIFGESGTGKERVARLLHELSDRKDNPFIAVNCGAIPSELMESEFFGHKKGSFTGAIQDKKGFFQAANGGTLFLDEIAELPLSMQVKLLRTLQEKTVRPVGQEQEIKLDVRVVSATHNDLLEAMKENRFRQDLYYRINVIQIDVPPLRQRPKDIELICHYILQELKSELNLPAVKLEQAALEKLKSYAYPGNIRELENILQRAVALCDDNVIGTDDILLQSNPEIANGNLSSNGTEEPFPDTSISHHHTEFDSNYSLDHYLEALERKIIETALLENNGNKTAAAEKLGISFRSIRYKIKKLHIDA